MSEAFRRCDIALPTLDDEQRLFGDIDADACLTRLRGLGVREIVLKLGGEGCVISAAGAAAPRVAPTKVGKIVDTTAAGDSFNAGYLYGRLIGKDPALAAAIGNRLAAVKIQHPGAIMPRDAMPKLDAS
jgi:2-dehydro-3-deoxygluconokinase